VHPRTANVLHDDTGFNGFKAGESTTFNYPTMAEAYRVAALNGLNRLF
jgi:NAD(P) transhydrogenase